MDAIGWIWWLAKSLLGLVWSVAWFLLGGWVSTLAQIGVIVLVIFAYKYGWRRAPQELLGRLGTIGRFGWSWIRAREPGAAVAPALPAARRSAGERRRQPGDVRINVSTTLSLLALAGLGLLALLP
jgi:hypothetical protein